MIKVLHVCYSDLNGGAARAAFRIHQAQRKNGIDSYMLVVDKFSDDVSVLTVPYRIKIKIKIANKLAGWIINKQHTSNSSPHSLNFFSSGISKFINQLDVDIVNLHWINNEMLGVRELSRINKPVVWTMHDMWPFCGTEHYDDLAAPYRYTLGYTKASRPESYSGFDLDRWLFNIKKGQWRRNLITIVSPSHWLAECAKKSTLFKDYSIHTIANCVNNDIYKPLDKSNCRALFNLPPNKKLILFGAISSTTDKRKGIHLLLPAMEKLLEDQLIRDEVELVIFGAEAKKNSLNFSIPCHFIPRLNDDFTLAALYNACDVFTAPSLQDNLPNTVNEAIACGLPCVAFDIGGMRDLIVSTEFGRLVSEMSIDEYCQKLKDCLTADRSENGVDIARELRGEESISNKYRTLYQSLLDV